METRYELIEQVGQGTFGSVFRAMNKQTGEMVAIKKLKNTSSSPLISPLEWEQEVRPLMKMNHPNIIKLKEFFLEKDKPVFVFEYMDCTLYDLMESRGMRPFSEPEIIHWCIQVFTGLAHMHQRGYFHQDLKPENLLVKQDIIKISDLGSACDMDLHPPYKSIAGTLWYRAPESLLHTGFYDSKVDMWAMGAIMVEMFTGSALFPGDTETDLISKICRFTGCAANILDNCSFAGQFDINMMELIRNASVEAISLIKWLCSWDPRNRPTATEALRHPFFRFRRCLVPLRLTVAAKGPPPGFGSSSWGSRLMAVAAAARVRVRNRGPTPGFESSCGSRLMVAAVARVRGLPPEFEYARLCE